MTINHFTKQNVADFHNEFDSFMKDFASKHGLEFKRAKATYDDLSFSVKVELFATAETGMGTNQIEWNRQCFRYGLRTDDFGKTFASNGKHLKITGIAPRKYKMPILLTDVNTGRGYKMSVDMLKTRLGYMK